MADNKEVAMLFDSSHCTGCRGCQVACKQWNVLPASLELNANEKNFNGTYQGPLDLNGDTRLIMTFDEKPSGDKFHPVNWSAFLLPLHGRGLRESLLVRRAQQG